MTKFKTNLNTYSKKGEQKEMKNAVLVEKSCYKRAKTKCVKTLVPLPL